MKYLLLYIFFLLGVFPMYAQNILFRQFPFFYQLSSNEIFDIYQDKTGYLWIGTTNGLARYDGYQLQTFRSDYRNRELLSNNSITCITDNKNYVWIATKWGLNLYDKETCRFTVYPDKRLQENRISYLVTDKNETVWVGVNGKIYQCSPDAKIVKEYALPFPHPSANNINSLYVDQENQLWALTGSGIFKYDLVTDSFASYPRLGNLNATFSMVQDRKGNYWIGTWGEGLWQFFPDQKDGGYYKQHLVINSRTGENESVFFSITQDDALGYLWLLSYSGLYALKQTDKGLLEIVDMHDRTDTYKMYTKICKDREGNLWLGSYDMAYTVFFDHSNVDNYPLPQLKKKLGWDANLLNLCQDENHLIWISQDRHGLCLYNPRQDLFADNNRKRAIDSEEVNIILKSRTRSGVWVNIRNYPRVMQMTSSNMQMNVVEDIDLRPWLGNNNGVNNLLEDKDGNLWIATWTYPCVKPSGQRNIIFSDKNSPWMYSLACDNHGVVWGVSSDHKVYRLTFIDEQIKYELQSSISLLFDQEQADYICVDETECLWIYSSSGEIFKSDSEKQRFEKISLEGIIEECSVLGITSERNNVWVITNKKIIQYDIYQKTCKYYSTSDGNVLVDVFRHKAMATDGKGGLYAGGHNGFLHIHPHASSHAQSENILPIITDVKVESKSILFTNDANKNTIRQVYLLPDSRNVEIFFSTLQYALNAQNKIAYKLEGVDQDWIFVEADKHSAFYNQLKKGTYSFLMKQKNADGEWTEGKVILSIVKEPAFYETWWAYTFYCLMISLGIYSILRIYMYRLRLQNDKEIQTKLSQIKLNYFTNISHELLTPLAVISCITDYFELQVPAFKQQSAMLRGNVDKLKRLIQQVLDFRKMDVGLLKLHVSEGDIRKFIENICLINFSPLAEKKNLILDICFTTEELHGYLDFDKLDKILYNLLSNAIKYTSESKHIQVGVQLKDKEGRRMIVINVEDEGVGISQMDMAHIFTRFYSSSKNRGVESNGIGLSLTKDLVNLHHGTIIVESVIGKGTCFTVELPIDKEFYTSDEMIDEPSQIDDSACSVEINREESIPVEEENRPAILLIDDNTELLLMMREMFRVKYNVTTANNGEQAWDCLVNNEADIIICDVMLPDINGWELCRRIKSDLRFSHIPVIILTAKNGSDDRVASYEAGADGYMAKPFELKILIARVDNLIKSSKMRQNAFRKEENIDLERLAYPSVDKLFLQSIIDSIEHHLEETEFDLERLSTEMNMSKSTLYRKIKSMSGMTPLDFVRNVKMKRACMMLLSRTQTISEVAYSVGFSSPKYFTKCFKEEFGVTPSEYIQKHSDCS